MFILGRGSYALLALAAALSVLSGQEVAGQRPMRAPQGWTQASFLRDSLREGAEALQGTQLKGAAESAVLDSGLIVEVAGALRAIRRQVPELKDAVVGGIPAVLTIAPTPALGASLWPVGVGAKWEEGVFPLRDSVPLTGLPSFDSLSRLLRVNHAELSGSCKENGESCWLHLRFSNYVNTPVAAAAYERIAGVEGAYASPYGLTFVTAMVNPADESEQQWLVTFVEGQGDCPAGCLGYIKTVVRYDRRARTAVVVTRGETRNP